MSIKIEETVKEIYFIILIQYYFFILIMAKVCLIIYDIHYDCEKVLLNCSMIARNDEIHDTSTTANVVLFKKLYRAFVLLEIRLAESKTDKNYDRLLMRSLVNLDRLVQGVRGNFFISLIADPILKSMSFPLKFPLDPVSDDNHHFCMNFIFKIFF